MIELPGVVERFCRVRTATTDDEAPFPLDGEGFLSNLVGYSWMSDRPSAGSLVSPSVAAASGALVLLGEPGVGKTTVFNHLIDKLSSQLAAVGHRIERFDGTELGESSVELLLELLRSLPMAVPAASSDLAGSVHDLEDPSASITIVLDQLDESPVLSRLAKLMATALQGRSTVGVRWLVACRAAAYPAGLTRVLERDGRKCVLADLAPLTRGQAVQLAASAGIDGGDLVAQAVAVGAGALASIPLTLKLLVELYRSGGGLTGTSVDLFDRSVRLLLQEHDLDRSGQLGVGALQRLGIARRAAASLILSGRRSIFTGMQLGGSEADIESGSLVGGVEVLDTGPFEVTALLVAQTLSTALFAPRGANHLAVAHSSMAAYLAAAYLVDVPDHQLRELFLVATNGGHTSIPASLRETATWLITLRPEHGGWLATADPQGLASHSAFIDNDQTRRTLVDALLGRAGDLELGTLPWQFYRTRLAYPGLASQLAETLAEVEAGPVAGWAARARARLAVRLAEQAEASPELTDRLMAMAERLEWSAHERRLAVDAITHRGEVPPVAPRLRRLLDTLSEPDAREHDADDELRGALLRGLWPQSLTLEEVLTYIQPRANPSYTGSYVVFLRGLPETDRRHRHTTDADLGRRTNPHSATRTYGLGADATTRSKRRRASSTPRPTVVGRAGGGVARSAARSSNGMAPPWRPRQCCGPPALADP